MAWSKSDQSMVKTKGKQMYAVAEKERTASYFANELFRLVENRWGGGKRALFKAAQAAGMSERSFKRALTGETKDTGGSVLQNLRRAYLEYTTNYIAQLQEKVRLEQAILEAEGTSDDALQSLANELTALAEKVETATRNKGKVK